MTERYQVVVHVANVAGGFRYSDIEADSVTLLFPHKVIGRVEQHRPGATTARLGSVDA